MTGSDQDTYLTGEQLSKLLQVSVKSISRWASSDPSMPVLRIGRTVRFPRERLLRWLKAREQGPGRAKRLPEPLHLQSEPIETPNKTLTEPSLCA
jgi:excisionase family DNA binding protein